MAAPPIVSVSLSPVMVAAVTLPPSTVILTVTGPPKPCAVASYSFALSAETIGIIIAAPTRNASTRFVFFMVLFLLSCGHRCLQIMLII